MKVTAIKQHYWAGFLRTLGNEGDNLIAFWRKITILDTTHGVPLEWFTVKSATSIQLWRKFHPRLKGDCLGFSNKETPTSKVTDIVNVLKGFENADKVSG